LTRMELACDQSGAKLSVDGRPYPVTCPGSHAEWIPPGLHVIQVAMTDYRTSTTSLTLNPGEKLSRTFRVHPDSEWTRTELPKDPWKPVVALSGGAAVLIAGVTLHFVAAGQVQSYDDRIILCVGDRAAQPTFEPCSVPADAAPLPGQANLL